MQWPGEITALYRQAQEFLLGLIINILKMNLILVSGAISVSSLPFLDLERCRSVGNSMIKTNVSFHHLRDGDGGNPHQRNEFPKTTFIPFSGASVCFVSGNFPAQNKNQSPCSDCLSPSLSSSSDHPPLLSHSPVPASWWSWAPWPCSRPS